MKDADDEKLKIHKILFLKFFGKFPTLEIDPCVVLCWGYESGDRQTEARAGWGVCVAATPAHFFFV